MSEIKDSKMPKYIRIIAMILLLSISSLYGQLRRADFLLHDRGELWETMKDDGTIGAPNPTNRYEFYPSMDWPGGPNDLKDKDDQRSYLYAAGFWMGWKDANGVIAFAENGPISPVVDGEFQALVKIENFIGSPDYDPDSPEESIVAEWTTPENVHVKRTSKVWSFPGLNNCIIIEYVVTNQTSATILDAYVGFPYLIRPSYQDQVVHNGWGDNASREDESVAFDSSRALLYAYDNYMATYTEYMWDWGNYWDDAEELRSPGYAGFALLGADPASNNEPQPAAVFWASVMSQSQFYTLDGVASKQSLYALLNGTDNSRQADPDLHITPIMLMSCGPYTIASLDSVRITIVEAVNGLPLEDVIDIPYSEFPTAQEKLSQGLGMLQETIDNAKTLYENNYEIVDLPPPSPDIEIVPLPSSQAITISWEKIDTDWIDPISGINDFSYYSVYRSDRAFIGPYDKIKNKIRVGSSTDRKRYINSETDRWQYDDSGEDVLLGVGYYYAVTSVDSDGNESWLTNRNTEAVMVSSQPAENTLDVIVFPNPFREASGFPALADANSIVWTNLPDTCDIRIYTSSGEHIRTLKHKNVASGEEIWDQLTKARQRTAPGIYFWTVDSKVGTAKGSLIIIK